MRKLPVGATALDFAYNVHTEIGNHSIGAKVNLTLVPLNHVLKSGDQVEIIISKIQKPQKIWLEYAITARAQNYILEALKAKKKLHYKEGREKLQELFLEIGMEYNKQHVKKFQEFNNITSTIDLYYEIAMGTIGIKELKNCCHKIEKNPWFNVLIPFSKSKPAIPKKFDESITERIKNKPEEMLLGEKVDIEYQIALCCNPIPGDDVIGLIMPQKPIMIHRSNCKIAIDLMSSFGKRIVKAKWNKKDPILFLAGIQFTGIDKIGFIYQLTDIISNKYKLKIRSFHLDSSNEVSVGKIMLYVHDTKNLNDLINDLKKIKEIKKINRMNPV
jgi:GTP pyrophosphokinase